MRGRHLAALAAALSYRLKISAISGSCLSLRKARNANARPCSPSARSMFINALTQGKPNKIIAYELNLRESTVKVHIRNIMKKVGAKNRTEVIFKVSDLFKN